MRPTDVTDSSRLDLVDSSPSFLHGFETGVLFSILQTANYPLAFDVARGNIEQSEIVAKACGFGIEAYPIEDDPLRLAAQGFDFAASERQGRIMMLFHPLPEPPPKVKTPQLTLVK